MKFKEQPVSKEETFEQTKEILNIKDTEKAVEKQEQLEKAERLSDFKEAPSFYRGVPVQDALPALFGKLKLNAYPKKDPVGSRDNAIINSIDAVAYGPTSKTKKGEKFICAIGFDTLPGTQIETSRLGRYNQFRITGPVVAKEIIIRFAGEKGKPKKALFFSPKAFYKWYHQNVE
jgi:hypothetical protein